ncbi:hypothetical protein B0H19DRAFT_651565 [Mycena capillaripes]|nr:hypothetical protein B0H19DRAFT_651565 [Mycena capillaripes]
MSVATAGPPEMRSIAPGRVSAPGRAGALQSLVISPNLDALLEHDERVRRAAQPGGTWSSLDSPGYTSPTPTQGLPPPPRRVRVPGSPQLFSPPTPRSPIVSQEPRSPIISQEENKRASTPQSIDSNPYINPAPLWVEEPAQPISPPPRTSSMGIMDSGRSTSQPGSSLNSSLGNGRVDSQQSPADDRSPSSSGTSSPGDSRFPPPFGRTPSLPRVDLDRFLKRSPKEKENKDAPAHIRKRSRSRGKLVKPRDSGGSSQAPSSPQMSQVLDTPRLVRRQRSSRSISVSSAISTDRESFIDLFSPSNQDFPADLADSPFAAASPSPSSRPRKPPIPTTPKPDFSRRSVVLPPRRPSPVGPPAIPVRALPPDTMPPTTNFLNPTERAQLIKKSRKLAQVFGQTPGAADFVPDARSSFLDVAAPSTSKSRHRPAASMNMIGQMPPGAQRPIPPWPAPDKTIHMTINGRRHSDPSTPVSDEAPTASLLSENNSDEPPSPHSFMDFSNNSNEDANVDVGPDDSVSVVDTGSASTPARPGRSRLPTSPSSPSLFENLSPEEQAEEERRKKRDKLAKLHRFLGSRVPTNLVLGPEYLETQLPPPVVALDGTLAMPTSPDNPTPSTSRSNTWVKRRRSSSAAVLSSWSDDLDRLKEDLNDKEKAIIVRRAQKMEKVFGVAPPQKLYNAQYVPTASGSGSGARTVPTSPADTPPTTPPATYGRNPNQTPYKRKSTRRERPSTADSDQLLLPNAEPSAGSFVYTHYQHSLNSLHDILDRNDKESLAELHQYLNDTSGDPQPMTPLEFATPLRPKAERRRSLPARTSMASLVSIASASSLASLASITTGTGATTTTGPPTLSTASTPDADASEFQQRRRRAAKLTQFFGVDYRDLIEDVLESIEHGLDAERRRGTLNPAEAEVRLIFFLLCVSMRCDAMCCGVSAWRGVVCACACYCYCYLAPLGCFCGC